MLKYLLVLDLGLLVTLLIGVLAPTEVSTIVATYNITYELL